MKLLPHQEIDAALIAAGDDLPNFSGAGTGKTLTTLEAIKLARFNGGLIIAPSIALPMWKEEIENYLGATARILKTGQSPFGGEDFLIASYGIAAAKMMNRRLYNRDSDVLVLDEAHYAKNRDSARTRALFGPSGSGVGGLFESAKQCWTLTGTPIMKHADDLWSQLRATQPNALRKYNVLHYEQFVKRYCITQMRQFHPRARPKLTVVSSTRTAELNDMLYNEIKAIRRTMDDVEGDMPPLTYRTITIPIKLDRALNDATRGKSEEAIIAALTGEDVVMAKAWRAIGEAKLQGCIEYVLDTATQGPALVGYWHTDTGNVLEEELRSCGLTVMRVMGGMSMDAKERVRLAFNAGTVDVLVGQISSMNVSWNLQKTGNRVIILEDHFSPGLIEQFIKRVWRYGQKNHVQVDFIKADHPLDAAFTKVRSIKQVKADEVLSPSRGKE